jgi:hypothetical protein
MVFRHFMAAAPARVRPAAGMGERTGYRLEAFRSGLALLQQRAILKLQLERGFRSHA